MLNDDEFRRTLEARFDIPHDAEYAETLYRLAHEYGHAGGDSEVAGYYDDLVELVNEVFGSVRPAPSPREVVKPVDPQNGRLTPKQREILSRLVNGESLYAGKSSRSNNNRWTLGGLSDNPVSATAETLLARGLIVHIPDKKRHYTISDLGRVALETTPA